MKTRGRPTSLDWDTVTPTLVNLRLQGATYGDLVDWISDNYGIRVSPQTTRLHTREAEQAQRAITGTVADPKVEAKQANPNAAKEAIYKWLTRHPEASIIEIAEGTSLSLETVISLHEAVRAENRGYTIVPPRQRREQFSETEMLDALADALDTMGMPTGAALSQQQYAQWRESLPAEEKRIFPSPLAYRRRYGSWGDACEAAGLPRNERPREYEGIDKQDAILWLAHFLRDLRNNHDYMVEATAPEYREWLRTNPQAPSEELLRIKGTWGYLLVEAAEIERNEKKLPNPKPVWTGGRVKKQRGLFSHV